MRRLRVFLAGVGSASLLFFALPLAAHADVNNFTVTDFTADYTLTSADPQGKLHIVERISVDFTDNNHGIVRAIPLKYKGQKLQLTINRVSSDTNAPAAYTTYTSNDNEVLKIGNPAQTVTGSQEYNIDYVVYNPITFYKDHDELYWDINGDQWQQPFTKVTATLHLPPGLDISKYGAKCFAGSYGAATGDCSSELVDNSTLRFETAHALTGGQTLTMLAGFPKGYFQPPTLSDKIAMYVRPIAELLLLPLVVGGLGIALWLKRGRDAKGRGTIIPEYSPPKDISPLEAGTIMDFSADNNDITATIIDLAVRGYIKIIEATDKRGLLPDKTTYTLQLLKTDYSQLNEYEGELMAELFGAPTVGASVDLSTLHGSLAATAVQIRKLVETALAQRGYFRANPLTAGRVLSIISGCLFVVVWLAFTSHVGLLFGVGALIATLIAWLIARAMPARTALGTATKEQLQGLKMYMDVAEKDRIRMLQSPNAPYAANAQEPVKTVELFEKLLPYAMVLGVEKQWAQQFESIYTQPPSWYSGNWTAFNAGYLASNLSSGLSQSINTAFATPSSSGSSGFSSGGGFSGGGGGGGGGGGW